MTTRTDSKKARVWFNDPKTGTTAAWFGDREVRVTRGGATEIMELDADVIGPEILDILEALASRPDPAELC